jgi:hypothetical protein
MPLFQTTKDLFYYEELAANQTYTNDATGTSILSVNFPRGKFLIEVFVRFTTNALNSKITSTTSDAQNILMSGYRESYNNGGSPARIAGVIQNPGSGGPWGNTTNTEQHARYGIIDRSSDSLNLYTITASQNTSSATSTIVGQGSYILVYKVK